MTGQRGRARLPHFAAFERFLDASASDEAAQLRALVAFGLYMESEGRWFKARRQDVTTAQLEDWHRTHAFEHELKKVQDTADRIVDSFVGRLTDAHQKDVLDKLSARIADTVDKRHAYFGQGAVDVVVGSAIWTLCLFGIAIALKYLDVDLLGMVKALH